MTGPAARHSSKRRRPDPARRSMTFAAISTAMSRAARWAMRRLGGAVLAASGPPHVWSPAVSPSTSRVSRLSAVGHFGRPRLAAGVVPMTDQDSGPASSVASPPGRILAPASARHPGTIVSMLAMAGSLGRWMEVGGVAPGDLDRAAIAEFRSAMRAAGRRRVPGAHGLDPLLECLEDQGVLGGAFSPLDAIPLTLFRLAASFCWWGRVWWRQRWWWRWAAGLAGVGCGARRV
jgi:hypothetical protein